jgi:hypothetical protein
LKGEGINEKEDEKECAYLIVYPDILFGKFGAFFQ